MNDIDSLIREKIGNNKKRVGAYIRVSTSKEEQIFSLMQQREYYLDKLLMNDECEFVGIYEDEGITGVNIKERMGFQKLIDDVKNQKIDLILTKSISRFGRNTLDVLKYVRLFKEYRCAIYFEEEHINTMGMTGELLLTVLSSVAQQEALNLSNNVKLGLKMKMKNGELVGFSSCYGYDYDVETKQLIVNKNEAEIVRKIFNLYLEGYGSPAIAKILNSENIPKRDKGKWNMAGITYILRNEKYVGDLIQGKHYVSGVVNKHYKINNGEKDMYLVRNHHEAIVRRDVFDNVQKILQEKRSKMTYNQLNLAPKNCFTGTIYCGFCGCKASKRNGYERGVSNYLCYDKESSTTHCSDSRRIPLKVLQDGYLKIINIISTRITKRTKLDDLSNLEINYLKYALDKYGNMNLKCFNQELYRMTINYVIVGNKDNNKTNHFDLNYILKTDNQVNPKKIDITKLKLKELFNFKYRVHIDYYAIDSNKNRNQNSVDEINIKVSTIIKEN